MFVYVSYRIRQQRREFDSKWCTPTIFLLDFRVDDDLYDVKNTKKNSKHKKKIWKLV